MCHFAVRRNVLRNMTKRPVQLKSEIYWADLGQNWNYVTSFLFGSSNTEFNGNKLSSFGDKFLQTDMQKSSSSYALHAEKT